MNLEEFKAHVIAQRKAQAKENTEKVLSVVNATITETKGKEN